MNTKRLLTKSLLFIGLSCTASFAFALGLKIINNTNESSTCRTPTGCSANLLGANGVTHPHESRDFTDAKIRIACKDHLENCKADVYMTNNCTGPVVASAEFALHAGLKSITPKPDSNYSISGTPGSTTVTIGYK